MLQPSKNKMNALKQQFISEELGFELVKLADIIGDVQRR